MVFTHNALPAGWALRAGASGGDDAGARCMGRSRGGLTTTIHPLVDANGLLNLTVWLAHDGHAPLTCSIRTLPTTVCLYNERSKERGTGKALCSSYRIRWF